MSDNIGIAAQLFVRDVNIHDTPGSIAAVADAAICAENLFNTVQKQNSGIIKGRSIWIGRASVELLGGDEWTTKIYAYCPDNVDTIEFVQVMK